MIRTFCGLCAAHGWAERKLRSGSRGGEAEKRKQGREAEESKQERGSGGEEREKRGEEASSHKPESRGTCARPTAAWPRIMP